ncbi:phosphotransferase [Kribbella sp. CA-293567]|uniref:phosphotransferase n=1 Tax=Kribbella sp. CA-293567 TaxID=3002436 RepID=UPI0022DDF55A|nr:phosphotransferase [Kribbella sp. CA-293567]WBQ02269.1 phosphotransferase [Kribbella sp. CA-293567]
MSGAPVVDYTATSARPPWSALPESLRTALAVALGTDIVKAGPSVTSGFTGGFAAPLYLADGREVFVKAAENSQHAYSAYQREAELVPQLPITIRAPRIIATAHAATGRPTASASVPEAAPVPGPPASPTTAGSIATEGEAHWFAVASERIDARMPGMPWTPEDFATVTATCEAMAQALTPSPFADLKPFAAEVGSAGFPRLRPADILNGNAPLPDGLPPWLPQHLQELQDLVDLHPTALAGSSAAHTDLRPDNLLIDRSGTCWTVDWNWLSLAPPWFDWAGLLPLAHRAGIDTAAAIEASPLTSAVPAEHLDCFAATIAVYMMDKLDAPPPPGCTPELRRHQRLYAWAFLDWLAVRRDWA